MSIVGRRRKTSSSSPRGGVIMTNDEDDTANNHPTTDNNNNNNSPPSSSSLSSSESKSTQTTAMMPSSSSSSQPIIVSKQQGGGGGGGGAVLLTRSSSSSRSRRRSICVVALAASSSFVLFNAAVLYAGGYYSAYCGDDSEFCWRLLPSLFRSGGGLGASSSSPPLPVVLEKVVQSNIKKHKNANRGVEGTVVKSMNRGYPLRTYLEEDIPMYDDEDEESSSDDDDHEDSDDDDNEIGDDTNDNIEEEEEGKKKTAALKVEEGEEEEAQQQQSDDNDNDEGELSLNVVDDATTSKQLEQLVQNLKDDDDEHEDEDDDEFYDVTAASKQAQRIAKQQVVMLSSKNNSGGGGGGGGNNINSIATTTTDPEEMMMIEKVASDAKKIMKQMKIKGEADNHARQWESNSEAVMKIKLIVVVEEDNDEEKKEEEEEEDGSSGNSDSADDDEKEDEMEDLPQRMKLLKKTLETGRKLMKGEVIKNDIDDDSSSDDDSGDSSSDDDEDKEEEKKEGDSSSDDDDDSSDDDAETTATITERTTSKKKKKKKLTTTIATKKINTNEVLLPNLSTLSPNDAAQTILNGITTNLQDRMSTMFTKAKTHECRAKIAEHFALFVNGLAMETKFPFQDWYYPSTCTAIPYYENWADLPPDVNAHELHHRVYQPPRDSVPEGTYIDNVDELELVYVILTHDQPEATIRLIESVYVENVTKFVVHVDGKETADETFDRLVAYAQEKNGEQQEGGGGGEYIRLVPNDKRVRVNWGGFSMVNATLVAMKTLFGLDYYAEHPEEGEVPGHDNPHAFSFHKMIHLASTTYPLASNTEIRDTLASYPLDANFMHILLQPSDPTPQVWNYFVECDDAIHRIYRLPPLAIDKGHGIDIHTSSQWFITSREFAWYVANPPKNSLVDYFREYIEHVVVADESFFGTILRNTHFCSTLHNDNFLHIQFGSWENESKEANQRDARKCLMRNPDHCGRSPTTMTLDYLPVLELSGDLFARKFDDVVEPALKDYIDKRREKEEERFLREEALAKEIEANKTAGVEVTQKLPLESWEFQGEGVMLVAKETVLDEVPLCLGLNRDGANRVYLLPCFKEDVPPTLSPDWYTGAVIIEEIEYFNRWDIGPCSSDGELKRNETTGELEMTLGDYSQTGPKCMLKVGDSIRKGRCLDVESDRTMPGGYANIFPCEAKWHQLFSFGNGDVAPSGGIHVSPPKHLLTNSSTPHLCLGVQGRSDDDEEEWIRPEHDDELDELWPWDRDNATEYYENEFKSLEYWEGIQLQTTPCSNEGAVVEFLYVPFITEEYDKDDEGEATDNEKSGAEGVVVGGDEL